MFVAKEAPCNFAHLNFFSGSPEKLHGKRPVLLTGMGNKILQKLAGGRGNLLIKTGRIYIAGTDGNFPVLRFCFFPVCNADDMNLSVQHPTHQIKLISLIVFFQKNFIQIGKSGSALDCLKEFLIVVYHINSAGAVFIQRFCYQRIAQTVGS